MLRLLTALFMLLCAKAQAQTSTEAYWNIPSGSASFVLKAGSAAFVEPNQGVNTVSLLQNGSHNGALLQTLAGTQNLLNVTQTSSGNAANATLIGNNNSLVVSQTGGGNALNLDLAGSGNRLILSQDGSDRLNMQGIQRDNTRLEVNQGSGANTLSIDNASLNKFSQGIPQLRIEQSGGATATIQQGKVF